MAGVQRDALNRLTVMTSEYNYHAYVPGDPRRDVFRYDSCHGLDGLHVHRFDTDGIETGAPAGVELDHMPPLGDVIREAEALACWLTEYHQP